MSNSWLPAWLGMAASVAFAAVIVAHLWHLVGCTWGGRAWHLVHVLMALGMIDMFAPTAGMVVPADVGQLVFAVAVVVAVGLAAAESVRADAISWIWLIAAVDLAAMVYMFAMTSTRWGWLTWSLVAWFAVEALGWATGRLSAVAARSLGESPVPSSVATEAPDRVGAVGGALAAPARHGTESVARHGSAYDVSVRVTLAVMSVGMAYMFTAMQLGMQAMPGM